ncbi:hypothetical protein GCM10010331_49280 [Streptomyces xanthochromogenes]|uniref:hypothetical protein n=1 Tax=Streptomyces xanthochromogenes TaxID=67384 RepID=UPI001671A98C|nr:hypothetical protein [Streptomyces xanthochromogenes]GHB55593.1 hypothetical protein GCM10010331_49280 [Streptomyces xanthochromogenes]
MSDFPHMLPTSNRATRDRIEAVLADLTWAERARLPVDSPSDRRTIAGILRKAFTPELARMRDTEETLARVRKVARQYREDDAIPVRRILAALYGEERP